MTQLKLNNVLFVGNYEEEYSRNAIFISGLRKNKIIVHEFNIRSYSIIKNVLLCIKNFKRLNSLKCDVILLHAPNNVQFLFAKLISKIKRIPLVHDIYISKLQTFYYDRGLAGKTKMPKLFYKIFYFLQDFFESALSNKIILDTYSHIQFFNHKYNIPLKKFRRILVGARDDIFFPLNIQKKNEGKFIVGYWGTFIPLHGIEYIIKAFELLKDESDLYLSLLGKGQTYEANKELAEKLEIKNIEFIPKVFFDKKELNKLPEFIAQFDVGLGLFGKKKKMLQVIPNKIYEGIAMKLPMITANTPGIREEFTDNKDIVLCDRANPESLAKSIMRLKNDEDLRKKVALGGYSLYKERFSIEKIGLELVNILEKILNGY